MAPPNNNKVLLARLVGNRDTREWINTFHIAKTDGIPWTDIALPTIGQAIVSWWNTYMKPYMSTSITLDQVQLRVYDPVNPIGLDYTTGLPITGTNSTGPAPANVTLALGERTGLAGRKYRGRIYVPGVLATSITADDRVNSSLLAAFISAIGALTGIWFPLGNYALSIFHRNNNLFTYVTSSVVEAILDSQRRRLPTRGR